MNLLLLVLPALAADPRALSLDQALDLVVQRNPEVESATLAVSIAEIDASRARLDRFAASLDGSAGVEGGIEKPWSEDLSDTSTSTWDLRASASVPLYAGGAKRAAIDAADAASRRAALDVDLTERDLVRATSTAWWTVRGWDLQIAATEDGLSLTRQALDIIRAKAEAGLAAGIDVNRSMVDLYAQQETLIEQGAARFQALQELLHLLQLPPGEVALTGPPPMETLDPVVLPADPTAARPELARQAASIDAADAAIRAARAATLPQVSLWGQAGVGTSSSPTSPAFDPALAEPGLDASAGLSLSWNPFDRFTTRDAVAQAKLARAQVDATHRAERSRMEADIRAAAADVDQFRRRAPLVRDQVALARDNLQIVQDLYAQGTASILDLFNAQAAFRQARSQEAALAVQWATAEADLRWLLGTDLRGTP